MPFPFFLLFLLGATLVQAQYATVELPVGTHGKTATLHYFLFSTKTHTLRVIDAKGPEPAETLEQAMLSYDCLAGCNGGFFKMNDRSPVGLVIANGQQSGAAGRKSSITSATLTADQNHLELIRSKIFDAEKKTSPCHLLQTGPFLVESGQAHPSLPEKPATARTFIAHNGKDLWLLCYIRSATLANLARTLAKPNTIPNFTIQSAVNFDGGPSSALWIKQPDHSPISFKERHPVANYIGIVPISSLPCKHSEPASLSPLWLTLIIGGTILPAAILIRFAFRKRSISN